MLNVCTLIINNYNHSYRYGTVVLTLTFVHCLIVHAYNNYSIIIINFMIIHTQ